MATELDPVTKELVGIAAAVAGHCAPCFAYHFQQAMALGIAPQTIQAVVSFAQAIRRAGDRHMDEFAERRIAGRSALETTKGEPDNEPQ